MKRIAIIPARGGSKRIPKKNIKAFHGKPIIAYSIEAAIQSNLFDEIMVSTDSEEIASVAEMYGAKVPFLRSKQNADDYATTFDVIKEVVGTYQKYGVEFEYVCCIYATAPFVDEKRLINAFDLLLKNNFDCVFPVIPYSFPIQRSIKIENNQNKMELVYPEHELSRSQDLGVRYHDAGQFYWMNLQQVVSKGKLWTDNSGVQIISELEGQDVDNEIDWKLAELKYQLLREKNII